MDVSFCRGVVRGAVRDDGICAGILGADGGVVYVIGIDDLAQGQRACGIG